MGLPNDVYLDPKNDYLIGKDSEKIKRVQEQNNITVLVLDRESLDRESLDWDSLKIRLVSTIGSATVL